MFRWKIQTYLALMLDKGRIGDEHCNAVHETNDEAMATFPRKACRQLGPLRRKKVREFIPSLQH